MILEIGTYNLIKSYAKLKKLGNKDPEMAQIAKNIESETGASEEALKSRSAFYFAEKIRAPTLILNGARDPRTDVNDLQQFAKKLKKNGVPVRLVIYPKASHQDLPKDKVAIEIRRFAKDYFFKR